MLSGKIAVVTGGGKGIGKRITMALAGAGATVIVVQRTALDAELSQLSNVNLICVDVEQPDSAHHVANTLMEKYGTLDILINNAGIMFEKTLEEMNIAAWQRMMTINTTFPLFLTKHCLPLMKQRRASVINIGSVEGISANPGHIAYCTSKAAIHGMTRAMAVDLGSYGIRCNAIAPGWIDTDLNQNIGKDSSEQGIFNKRLRELHPLGRTGKPDDVANLVKFLASDESAFITGQIIIIDGGRTAKLPMPS